MPDPKSEADAYVDRAEHEEIPFVCSSSPLCRLSTFVNHFENASSCIYQSSTGGHLALSGTLDDARFT
jgi:hypothetical protein